MKITNKAIFGGWIGGWVPVGCTGGVNRCRSYLRYQKTQKLKISNFGVTPLIHTWAVRSTRCQYAHYSAQFSIKGVTPNITFRVNDENVKLIVFSSKNDLLVRAPPPKRRELPRCLRSDQGEGEIFEILPPSNGFSLHLRLNSTAFCFHNIHYNKTLFQHNSLLFSIHCYLLFYFILCFLKDENHQ